jgi:hypothetical protein
MSNVIDPYDEERAPFLHREPGDPLGPDQDESATVSLEESLQNQVVPIVKSARRYNSSLSLPTSLHFSDSVLRILDLYFYFSNT